MNTIVTHYCPRHHLHEEMFALSSGYNKSVADKLGWKFFADSKRRVPQKDLFRERSAILAEAASSMQDGDKMLWIDGDALIVGKNTSAIFNELGSADVGATKLYDCWHTGVLAISINTNTRELLTQMRDHIHATDEACHENWTAHECNNCKIPVGQRGPLCGSSKIKLIELAHKWNDEAIHDDTEIVGYHGTFAVEKLKNIKEFVEKNKA